MESHWNDPKWRKMLLEKGQWNVTIADTLHTCTQTNIHQPMQSRQPPLSLFEHVKIWSRSLGVVWNHGIQHVLWNSLLGSSTWRSQNWKVVSRIEWNTDRLGHLLHTWSKGHCKREFISSEPKVNKYKRLGLAKWWKKEQIGSTTPMGKSLPQNISFAESALIWKETAPLRPRRPDHHSHDKLLKRTYPLTLGQPSQ